MSKYLNTKEHKDWSRAIRDRDGECVICGRTDHLSAHHLIPKEIERFRTQMRNGITLCFKHHTRYGHGLSPHSHGSVLFFCWMLINRPKQLEWVKEMFNDL